MVHMYQNATLHFIDIHDYHMLIEMYLKCWILQIKCTYSEKKQHKENDFIYNGI